MKLLVLGGTAFLGRHVVAEALTRGYHVTTFNRGQSGPDADGVEALHGDRTSRGDLEQLRSHTFDAVVDTSGFDPRTVRSGLDVLADVGHYTFVSSISVYEDWPGELVNEESPVFDCPSDAGPGIEYGAGKAGAEQAVTDALGDRALLVRAGLILGPYENVGGCRGGCAVPPAAATCSRQEIPTARCSSSTLATSRHGCSTARRLESVAHTTRLVRPATRPWRVGSAPASR